MPFLFLCVGLCLAVSAFCVHFTFFFLLSIWNWKKKVGKELKCQLYEGWNQAKF